jgi:hypothetical protein
VTYSVTSLLQISMNTKMRSNAFAAYGALSSYGVGSQHHAFLEQVTPRFYSGCFTSIPLAGSCYHVSLLIGCCVNGHRKC